MKGRIQPTNPPTKTSNHQGIPPMNDLVQIDQSALSRLREKARLNTEVQVWKPEAGETLEGVIGGSRKVEGPFGPQDQMIVQTPEGTIVAVWLTAWLLGQLRANSADIGDLVSILFVGKEVGARGQSFNRMSVTVLKA